MGQVGAKTAMTFSAEGTSLSRSVWCRVWWHRAWVSAMMNAFRAAVLALPGYRSMAFGIEGSGT